MRSEVYGRSRRSTVVAIMTTVIVREGVEDIGADGGDSDGGGWCVVFGRE